MHQIVASELAPAAIGPYSQAIMAHTKDTGTLIFCSWQIGLDPATGKVVEGDVGAQTRRVLENLEAVLKAAGAGLVNVVKTTVYMKDLNEFKAMNEAYATFFSDKPPARATVEVARLPRDVRVEIDCIAMRRF